MQQLTLAAPSAHWNDLKFFQMFIADSGGMLPFSDHPRGKSTLCHGRAICQNGPRKLG
jgi:hypothetical protein